MQQPDLSPALDAHLTTAFPLLYRDRHADPQTPDGSQMGWGFCCGDGWFSLLWDLSSHLEARIAQMSTEQRAVTRAAQVKEKLGELRFYLTGWQTPQMRAAIEQATAASHSICECCGAPGTLHKAGYWGVRCIAHLNL